MRHRSVALLFVLASTALVGLWLASPGWTETLVQSTLDSRIVLAFRVNSVELQKWLPAPWQPNPAETGPSKDANLMVTFVDRLLDQDAEGKPAAVPTYRIVAVGVPGKNPQTGESAPLVMRIFNSNPQGVPGFYKTAVQATVTREQKLKGVGVEPGTGTERWEMRDPRGGMIELRLKYTQGIPSRAKSEAKPHSGSDPATWRIYRFEQSTDVLRSIPTGIDRVKSYKFRATVPELAKLFDGSEQLVSISSIPSYTRQTFLP
jgi:hypothetical protein